jgi:hypothetical protein
MGNTTEAITPGNDIVLQHDNGNIAMAIAATQCAARGFYLVTVGGAELN